MVYRVFVVFRTLEARKSRKMCRIINGWVLKQKDNGNMGREQRGIEREVEEGGIVKWGGKRSIIFKWKLEDWDIEGLGRYGWRVCRGKLSEIPNYF